MAKTIEFYGDIVIDFKKELEPKKAVEHACELIGMTDIGGKVSKEVGTLKVIVKLHDRYLYVKNYCYKKMSKICFTTFEWLPEEYEDAGDYKYFVPNCDINRDEIYCFKENEKDLAEYTAELWSSIVHEM